MKNLKLRKFAPQTNPKAVNDLHRIADAESRKFHAALNEAFRDSLNKKGISLNDRKVMSYFTQSLQEFEGLYKELAK